MSQDTMVVSDPLSSTVSDLVRQFLNGPSFLLRAYSTSVNPTPSTVTVDLSGSECVFDTYAPLNTVNAWQLPQQIVPGEYAIVSGPWGWSVPTTTPDTIAGIFIVDGSNILQLVYEFSNPIPYSPGSSLFQFNLQVNTWARVLLP